MPNHRIELCALLTSLALLTACVGLNRYEKPHCRELYKGCTDRCIPLCESREPSPFDDDEPEDGDFACSECVSKCQEEADACEDDG